MERKTIPEVIASFLAKEDYIKLREFVSELKKNELNTEDLAWKNLALGLIAWNLDGQPNQSIIYLSNNLALEQVISKHVITRTKVALGLAYDAIEQFDRATYYYHQALTDYEQDANYPRMVAVLVNIAIIHMRCQEYTQGFQKATQAIELARKANFTDSFAYAYAWNTIACAHRETGLFDLALAEFAEMLTIGEKLDNQKIIATACHNLGELWLDKRVFDRSENYYQRAVKLLPHTDPALLADSLGGLAYIKLLQGDFESANTTFNQILEYTQKIQNHHIITNLHLARAALAEKQGNHATALSETRQAVASVESLRANIVLSDDRARFSATRINAYEQLITRLIVCNPPETLAEAFYVAEQSKSRTLLELLQQRNDGTNPIRPPKNVPSEWLAQEAELRQRLLPLYSDSNSNPQIIALENQLHERIRITDADFASFQSANPLNLAQVQARLPHNTCLIEYIITDKTDSNSVWGSFGNIANIWAFVITQNTAQVIRLPLTPSQLRLAFRSTGDSEIGRLPHLTPDGSGRLNPPVILKNLHKFLIDPLGSVVTQAELLFIVPHGLLHYVPFHALLPDQTVLYAPSSTLLLDTIQSKTPSTQCGVLAIGCNLTVTARPLHFAEIEAHVIATNIGDQTLLGINATRSAVLSQAKSYRYIHLACHGLFRPQNPMLSYLHLHDVTLDANDVIQHLELNADLVVLSACETGLNQIMRGDELMGFIRAFLYAGTPAVLVSQWIAADISTCILMRLFYTALQNFPPSLSPTATALSHAQRILRNLTTSQIRKQLSELSISSEIAEGHLLTLAHALDIPLADDAKLFDHPFYWAPFFMMGGKIAKTSL